MMHDLGRIAEIERVTVPTKRVRMQALVAGSPAAPALVLIHGNVSCARFFQDLILRLAGEWRVWAPDLRGFGGSEALPVDATRGLRDFGDDLFEFLRVAEVTAPGQPLPILGWSMGGGVALQFAMDHPSMVSALVLESPMSPRGFGGTRDADGTPCWPDFAGSGGGTANPELVRRLAAADRSDESDLSPRRVMNTLYMRPGSRLPPEWEEELLSAMLSTVIGDGNYPGDSEPSPNWPYVAPGTRGVVNSISPRYCDLSAIAELRPGPDILWVRGADDQIVSDQSLSDIGHLAELGLIPGWPGAEVYPAQPMVTQTRAVLTECRKAGTRVEEVVLADCGHSPHLEHPEEFVSVVDRFLGGRT